ncbi:MAG: DUF1543 domain-containing protein [Chitinophagaceae bacterium]
MEEPVLFMLLLGCRPKGRHTEQHDIFFGIGKDIKDLIPEIKKSWPEAAGEIHIDAWRRVECVDGYSITVQQRTIATAVPSPPKENELFFINLGGYKENEFEEFHYKILVVADTIDAAKKKAKQTAFFKHTSLGNTPNTRKAVSHIDDKYGIDVDDIDAVKDMLPPTVKSLYSIHISASSSCIPDAIRLGYFRLKDL